MSSVTKNRFLNIDALRGIAAFAVVLVHLFGGGELFNKQLAPENLSLVNSIYFIPVYGYAGVFLFFVISGFCIHLRWAKAMSKGTPLEYDRQNFIAFWKRRFIRLYPAYLVAIVLFLGWMYSQGKLEINAFFVWDMISHLLMIHNFEQSTAFSMNSVFWTLALEEQLYLLYFVLLYLRKKGWAKAFAVLFFARFLWFAITISIFRLWGFQVPSNEGSLAMWWMWALGALAVENYYKIIELPKWCYSIPLFGVSLLIAAYIRYKAKTTGGVMLQVSWFFEPVFWGAAFFFLVNRVMLYEGKIKNALTSKIVVLWAFVGLFSYSLYLTHELFVEALHGRPIWLTISIILVFAYLFFLFFEKPFMKILARKN